MSYNENRFFIQIGSHVEEFDDSLELYSIEDPSTDPLGNIEVEISPDVEMFSDDTNKRTNFFGTEPLIPDNIEDEAAGSRIFSERFTSKYGEVHPEFYQSTLDDAVKEAFSKPAKEKKILAIYLHDEASQLTDDFCKQVLGNESVIQVIDSSCILWGWDLTSASNRARLKTYAKSALGEATATILENISFDSLPALVLIMNIWSSTEILSITNGNVEVEDLLSKLIEAVEVFSKHQRVEEIEERERNGRELLKRKQDEALLQSLKTDRCNKLTHDCKLCGVKKEARKEQAQSKKGLRKKTTANKWRPAVRQQYDLCYQTATAYGTDFERIHPLRPCLTIWLFVVFLKKSTNLYLIRLKKI